MMRKMMLFKLLAPLAALFVLPFAACAKSEPTVITYPAPASEKARTSWSVSVNGKNVDIYKALSPQFEGGEYYFAVFDFDRDAEITVKSAKPLDKAELFPNRIKAKVSEKNRIVFDVAKPPFSAVVIRDERNMPLVIFGNPLEKDAPKAGDKNVVYFGAGVHTPDEIKLSDNQTLYIAGGAVVKSRLRATGKNITVRGRGILSGELSERFSTGNMLDFDKCENLSVRDIVCKDPSGWMFVVRSSKGVEIDNVKLCASRMINDDAIDLCNTSDVSIKNVFARAQDDIIAVKGMGGAESTVGTVISGKPAFGAFLPCNNITIENCLFWTDIANIFRIGFECAASEMADIKVRNIDVPFYAVNCRDPRAFWSKGIIWLQAANAMPMRNVSFENITVRSNGNDMCMLIANPRKIKLTIHADSDKAGKVFDCSLKNFKVYGKKGGFKGTIFIDGVDENSFVKNLSLENFEYFGEKIGADYKHFELGKNNTSGVSIK